MFTFTLGYNVLNLATYFAYVPSLSRSVRCDRYVIVPEMLEPAPPDAAALGAAVLAGAALAAVEADALGALLNRPPDVAVALELLPPLEHAASSTAPTVAVPSHRIFMHLSNLPETADEAA